MYVCVNTEICFYKRKITFGSFAWLGLKVVFKWASLVAQTVENLPAMHEPLVQSLSWEDPLEKGMATHSSILAWRISWTEEPGRPQSMDSQRVEHD